ncbi:MAG TPA: Maf family protein, partial [Tepidisphaeraceae bacterium]
KDAADAKNMLMLLSGTTHLVITGVAVMHVEVNFHRLVRVISAVRMRSLSTAEMDRYIAGGDWQGKAGGYGIQDADNFPSDLPHKAPFVIKQAGSRSNIVGLPMSVTRQLLAEAGVHPPRHG